MANAICLMYTESYSYIADPSHRTLLLSRHPQMGQATSR